jgi:hypothetical protein
MASRAMDPEAIVRSSQKCKQRDRFVKRRAEALNVFEVRSKAGMVDGEDSQI